MVVLMLGIGRMMILLVVSLPPGPICGGRRHMGIPVSNEIICKIFSQRTGVAQILVDIQKLIFGVAIFTSSAVARIAGLVIGYHRRGDVGTGTSRCRRGRSSLTAITVVRRVCSKRWTAEGLCSSVHSNSSPKRPRKGSVLLARRSWS